MLKKKNQGFTLVEVGVASIVMLITVSGVVSTFVASMKTTKNQMSANQAQNIVQEIINEQVRDLPVFTKDPNTPFEKSLCGNPETVNTSNFAFLLVTNNLTTGAIRRKIFKITSNQDIPYYNPSHTLLSSTSYADDLKKISPSAYAVIEMKPVTVGGTSSLPIYSTSKLNVKVLVRWKKDGSSDNTGSYSEIDQSTIVTNNSIFVNDASKM